MAIRIACLLSGGVDSLAASHLLSQNKHRFKVVAIHLTCWKDEFGTQIPQCSTQDYEDAKLVASRLRLEFHHLDFSKQYWNDVFINFLESYQRGETPNPDILCNQHIKFGSVLNYVEKHLDCTAIASGHYAKISPQYHERVSNIDHVVRLYRAKHKSLDQTFFLSRLPQEVMPKIIFTLGDHTKEQCRETANALGLDKIAKRDKTSGICFIGKRNFQRFIDDYLAPRPGPFIDIDTGEVVGEHCGFHFWTIGQRTRLQAKSRYFVVEKIQVDNSILVASSTNHPALYKIEFIVESPHWIAKAPGGCRLRFKFQQIEEVADCTLEELDSQRYRVKLDKPKHALTPGQYCVFYNANDEECLGSAKILSI
ncbi:Mitochondrial tRNA-specific 2-thiouridylase 1, partial [Fragariocoptes setiger]